MQRAVYPPREDSALLAAALACPKNVKCLDMGTGSGIQALRFAELGATEIWLADINSEAVACAKEKLAAAGFHGKTVCVESDLFEKIPANEKFDAIAFNPPYLPSDGVKHVELDGGKNGRETLDRFLSEIPQHLAPHGECFFLQTDLNGEKETMEKLPALGLCRKIVARQKLAFEELMVFRCRLRRKTRQG